MINFLLKFQFAVEIGAYKAYLGHWCRTNNNNVYNIAADELRHQRILKDILLQRKSKPSVILNFIFSLIGDYIQFSCQFFPVFMLDRVAHIMEIFNIISYSKMAELLPEHAEIFIEMKENEEQHSNYFKNLLDKHTSDKVS